MALHTTIHLYNVAEGREADCAAWFDGPHRDALSRLRGFRGADRFEVTEEQALPDIPQPWRFLEVYEFDFDTPEIDITALGPLLAEGREQGLFRDDDAERIYTYRLYTDWVGSANWQRDRVFSGVSVILANSVPGRDPEYQTWYDDVHCGEVTNVPGHVAMKRGALAETQVAPRRFCPGDQVVLCAQQTDDLAFTVGDFLARARGTSPSGIAMAPRSKSASIARTVHYFRKISGPDFWSGGIAYAGDLSAYPERAHG